MKNKLINDAILRVGEVSSIDGRKVYISLDKNKNASELFFDGARFWIITWVFDDERKDDPIPSEYLTK